MNERIQELAEEHGFINEFMTIGERNDALQKYKKFSELLIQETLIQMAVQMAKYGDEQSNNPAWYRSEETVKKYFGVRE